MKTLDGGKLYIVLLVMVLMLAAFYLVKGTTAKPLGRELAARQEQAYREQSDAASETALKWAVHFFSTEEGAGAWLAALSPITSEQFLGELEGVVLGKLKTNEELLDQTRSYLEAMQDQNVRISLAGISRRESDWHVSLLAQTDYMEVTADMAMEIVVSLEGEDPKVKEVHFQQLGD